MQVPDRPPKLRRRRYSPPAFGSNSVPLVLRPSSGRPISARTCCNGLRMISDGGGRRPRAGRPPPGSRRNLVSKKPEPQVETFAFDVDNTFSPTLDSLGDDDDVQFAAWAASAKGQASADELLVDDHQLSSLLGSDNGVSSLRKEDNVRFGEGEQEGDDVRAFDDEDEDEDDEVDGDEEQEDDEEVDDDVVAELDGEDPEDLDDNEASVISLGRSSSRRVASPLDLSLSGIDLDVNDEEPDDELILDTLVDDEGDMFDIDSVLPDKVRTQANASSAADLDVEPLEDPSEAELQSAAELLTDTGLLGLGAKSEIEEDDSLRPSLSDPDESPVPSTLDASVLKKGATLPPDDFAFAAEENDDEDDVDFPLEAEFSEEQDSSKGLDAYNDLDDEEEADFPLTSKSEERFGRVWELNEDNYITITEPGQTYGYELDEEEANDQEMATLRRGAKGGWGSGLQNDSANKFPEGSREWIARRSYDLVAQATPKEMKLWTKRHSIPPPAINSLYPDMSKPMQALGKMELTQSLPDTKAEIRGVGSHFEALGKAQAAKSRQKNADAKADSTSPERRQRVVYGTDALLGSTNTSSRASSTNGNAHAQSALERAVKFPCSFKFKVEGSGDGLIDSLISDVERVLQKTLPRSTFVTEPAGRYLRVVFAVEVEEARHVTDLYDAFRHNPLVKFSYG